MKVSRKKPPATLESLERTLHRQGLPLTIQRRIIFENLQEREDHPTADQIYEEVKKLLPGISKTTVYRVLETLVQVKAIRKVDHPGSSSRFDARTDHHHHWVCIECHKMMDVEDSKTFKFSYPKKIRRDFKILDYSIHFTGICENCNHDSLT